MDRSSFKRRVWPSDLKTKFVWMEVLWPVICLLVSALG
ncbi:pectin acetylesterase 8-like isoform X1 [Iris pallida]|uniref:Pectin acetylesterase 8-like isoform X1 n=1 Tax=Iris pallida TaxID=29817 RepID=A0AAX6G5U5_IRIPA|nr:pectin acetylesterase 8-like isoform X1 [Iris pallida]